MTQVEKALPQGDLDFILDQTASIWNDLKGARLLLTGGTGFIGRWLLEALCHANRRLGSRLGIQVLSRRPDMLARSFPHLTQNTGVTLISGDVRRFSSKGPLDGIIHAAAAVTTDPNDVNYREVLDINGMGTRHVLEHAVQKRSRIFLLTSSGAVYGTQPTSILHMSESNLGCPNSVTSAYAEGKRLAEWWSSTYSSNTNLKAKIARIYAVIGPGMPLDGPFAAGNFMRDTLSGHPVYVAGDGTPLRSYLYVADLVIWLLKILVYGDIVSPYNVGSEKAVSIRELAHRIIQLSCRGVPVIVRDSPSDQPPARYVPDTTKIRESLGVVEYTPLDRAIRKTLEWIGMH